MQVLNLSAKSMSYNVTETRKTGSSESEISHYRYFTDSAGYYSLKSKQDLWQEVKDFHNLIKFYSYNIKLGTKVECTWKLSTSNEWYLQSNSNGTEKDNLLNLPDC